MQNYPREYKTPGGLSVGKFYTFVIIPYWSENGTLYFDITYWNTSREEESVLQRQITPNVKDSL